MVHGDVLGQYRETRRSVHVHAIGKSKLDALKGKGGLPKISLGGQPLMFTLEDEEREGRAPKPAFNVLLVQTPQPTVFQSPLVRVLADTVQETIDLVKPIFRLGIPETSLQTKCPYYK